MVCIASSSKVILPMLQKKSMHKNHLVEVWAFADQEEREIQRLSATIINHHVCCKKDWLPAKGFNSSRNGDDNRFRSPRNKINYIITISSSCNAARALCELCCIPMVIMLHLVCDAITNKFIITKSIHWTIAEVLLRTLFVNFDKKIAKWSVKSYRILSHCTNPGNNMTIVLSLWIKHIEWSNHLPWYQESWNIHINNQVYYFYKIKLLFLT